MQHLGLTVRRVPTTPASWLCPVPEENFLMVCALCYRKHANSMKAEGLSNPSARLFSNPAGDYGSMVNERVGASNWEDGKELGDTWASRNAFSYGRCIILPNYAARSKVNVKHGNCCLA